jgi:putative oxidoreductase
MASNPTTPAVPDSWSGRLAAGNQDVILLAGRLALGAIFVKSGLQKLLALSAFAASLAGRGVPQSSFWAVVGATVEFVGGILIVTGLRARYASLLMILFVIVATGISHRYWEYTEAAAQRLQESQFFKNLAILGGFVVLFAAGAGRFSLDAWLAARGRNRPLSPERRQDADDIRRAIDDGMQDLRMKKPGPY